MTRQSEFPHLQLLLEVEDDDIVAGLRSVLDTVRQGWRDANYSRGQLETLVKRNLKKVDPDGKRKLHDGIAYILHQAITQPEVRPDAKALAARISNEHEATAAIASLASIEKALQEIIRAFIRYAEEDGATTAADARIFQQRNAEQGKNMQQIKLGPQVLQFITEHRDMLDRLFQVSDGLLIEPVTISNALYTALKKTPATGEKGRDKPTAANGVYYFLYNLRTRVNAVKDQLVASSKDRPLPKGEPEDEAKPKAKENPKTPAKSASFKATVGQHGAGYGKTTMTMDTPATPGQKPGEGKATQAAQAAAAKPAASQESAMSPGEVSALMNDVKQLRIGDQKVADNPDNIKKAMAIVKRLPKGTTSDAAMARVAQALLKKT